MATGVPVVIDVAGVVHDYRALRPLRVKALEVREGERVALSGLDERAAEVFVNLLNGALLPDEGVVRMFGTRSSDIRDEEAWFASLERVGIVTPRAVLLNASSVAQNLALPFTLDIEPIPGDLLPRIHEVAAAAGLDQAGLGDTMAGVSPAVRMRVHLARALALGPRLLILEHPTLGLHRPDVPGFARAVAAVARARFLTVLALTGDQEFADVVADRALALQPATGALVNERGWRRWL